MKIQIEGFFSPIWPEAAALSVEDKMPPVIGVAFMGRHGLPDGRIGGLDVELTNFEFPGIFRLKAARVIDYEMIIAKNAIWMPGDNL
jgi:hypothetical protein